jgi:hypothetical protein
MINFICTFWGDKYSKQYVENLYSSVSKHYIGKFKFYCQTDQQLDIPGVIEVPFTHFKPINTGRFPDKPKMNLWEPGIWGITGRKVYFDLDVVILGNINRLIDMYNGKPIINRSWWQDALGINQIESNYLAHRGITNGSLYIWEDSDYTRQLWEHISKYHKYIFYACINGSDGYFSSCHLDKFDFVPREMSFSYHNEKVDNPHSYVFCTVDTKRGSAAYADQLELHEIKELWNAASN